MSRGFLLHSRPYRETSLIATFMTDSDGRIDLLVRSARGRSGKKIQPVLPFCLYELSWVGKGELKNLQFFETLENAIDLSGTALFCGFYLNELLYRLLLQNQPEYVLLRAYSLALQRLSLGENAEPVLREFELILLDALGYGLDLLKDRSGSWLEPDCNYDFMAEVGLTRSQPTAVCNVITGEGRMFTAIAQRDFSSPEVRQLAKLVLREALSVYLRGLPLRSRDFFR